MSRMRELDDVGGLHTSGGINGHSWAYMVRSKEHGMEWHDSHSGALEAKSLSESCR